MLSKPDTIEEITRLSPTANPSFLAEFSKEELNEYLERLNCVTESDICSPRANPRHTPGLSDTHRVRNGLR